MGGLNQLLLRSRTARCATHARLPRSTTSHIWSSRGFRCCRLVSRVSMACRCVRASLDTFVVVPRRNEPDPSGTNHGDASIHPCWSPLHIHIQTCHAMPGLKSGARTRCESHVNLTLRQPIYSHHQLAYRVPTAATGAMDCTDG
jgi:hypothetical protein